MKLTFTDLTLEEDGKTSTREGTRYITGDEQELQVKLKLLVAKLRQDKK